VGGREGGREEGREGGREERGREGGEREGGRREGERHRVGAGRERERRELGERREGYVCVCACVCVRACVCVYIHTFVHTYIQPYIHGSRARTHTNNCNLVSVRTIKDENQIKANTHRHRHICAARTCRVAGQLLGESEAVATKEEAKPLGSLARATSRDT
jgi:hypothetical protein